MRKYFTMLCRQPSAVRYHLTLLSLIWIGKSVISLFHGGCAWNVAWRTSFKPLLFVYRDGLSWRLKKVVCVMPLPALQLLKILILTYMLSSAESSPAIFRSGSEWATSRSPQASIWPFGDGDLSFWLEINRRVEGDVQMGARCTITIKFPVVTSTVWSSK